MIHTGNLVISRYPKFDLNSYYFCWNKTISFVLDLLVYVAIVVVLFIIRYS